MALKVKGSKVIDNTRRGTFKGLYVGQYETGSEPSAPQVGDIIWDKTEGTLVVYNGQSWNNA